MGVILGIDWKDDFGDEFADDFLDATLIRVTEGTRTGGDLMAGTNPTSTNYACKGYEASWTAKEMATISLLNGDRIRVTDRKIVLLGKSLGAIEPRQGDRVTIGGATYNVTPVEGNSGGAGFVLVGRK